MKRLVLLFSLLFSLAMIAISSITTATTPTGPKPEPGSARKVKTDSVRYFIALAGRSGVFYDRSGPTFPALIRVDGPRTQVDAVGVYAAGGKRIFGRIPAGSYNPLMKEPRRASDVLLRLEINRAQYEQALKILRTWERRIREGALLYPDLSLNHLLLVKQVTESLNRCGAEQCPETIKLYRLDWGIEDEISDRNPPSLAAFLYFKELRRLNESRHVR
ncbi:MAG TPA: hypothetical protein VJ302_17260 [Blastocatellia bacterium]|nr:hypothetical protein [Blastocatellia bacterium]